MQDVIPETPTPTATGRDYPSTTDGLKDSYLD